MRPLHSQRSCFDDRQHGRFDGVVEEFRYRLLDRDHAPFALAIGAEPHWSRVDETTGEPVDNYGGDLLIAVDKELIKRAAGRGVQVAGRAIDIPGSLDLTNYTHHQALFPLWPL